METFAALILFFGIYMKLIITDMIYSISYQVVWE